VSLDGPPKQEQVGVEIELPNGSIPNGRPTLDQFATPDVIDQHIDAPVLGANPSSKPLDLR
jgi:hypothetical protein